MNDRLLTPVTLPHEILLCKRFQGGMHDVMTRYPYPDLVALAADLMAAAGMDAGAAKRVADLLVMADAMGHDTHGLQLLPRYLDALAAGTMLGSGAPEIISDQGAVAVWDGRFLSGVWLTATALDLASEKARRYGIGAVAIRRAHHTACLQAYLPQITARGQIPMIFCSDPTNSAVAPYGGLDPVFSPDPIAVGLPTDADPILIDMSASITTNGMAGRLAGRGERFAGQWAQDSEGRATNDPTVLTTTPPGSLLPTGGQDHGHKGYGLALIVEAFTQGLPGFGRKDRETQWTNSIYVQVVDPAAFAGTGAFEEQTSELVSLSKASRPRPGGPDVRLPGHSGLARQRTAMDQGVTLRDDIAARLSEVAAASGHALPQPI